MKTSFVIFGNYKITFSFGDKVRITQDDQLLPIANIKQFKAFAKNALDERQRKIASACIKTVR